MNIIETMEAGFGNSQKSGKGPRPHVLESHAGNIQNVLGHFRELGHTVTGVDHTDTKKMPAGMSRSVIHHKSGPNKLKTVVRTAFNGEGGEHGFEAVTGPDDTDSKKDSKQQDASADASE